MAKKRKSARKTAASKSRKAAAPGKPAKARKFTRDDQITALVVAAVIVIFFLALYLYQGAKSRAELLNGGPAIVALERAAVA